MTSAPIVLDPDVTGVEVPMPSRAERLALFEERAVPEPADAIGHGPELTDDARLDVPSVVVCTSMTSLAAILADIAARASVG